VERLAAETEGSRQQDWAGLIFDQALLSEGGRLEDPAGFVRRMNELIVTLAQGAGSAPARKPAEQASKEAAGKGARETVGETAEPDAGEQGAEPASAEQNPKAEQD